VIWAIIVCAAFGVNVGTDLMPLWSAFVAASFIFGTSAKDAFEAIIFVFVTVNKTFCLFHTSCINFKILNSTPSILEIECLSELKTGLFKTLDY
jgi:hypothetical protein